MSEVAQITAISVRALHHYDEIGLLSFAIHTGLADGYEADCRFAENIDKFGAGLTPFLAEAMRANARRSGG